MSTSTGLQLQHTALEGGKHKFATSPKECRSASAPSLATPSSMQLSTQRPLPSSLVQPGNDSFQHFLHGGDRPLSHLVSPVILRPKALALENICSGGNASEDEKAKTGHLRRFTSHTVLLPPSSEPCGVVRYDVPRARGTRKSGFEPFHQEEQPPQRPLFRSRSITAAYHGSSDDQIAQQ